MSDHHYDVSAYFHKFIVDDMRGPLTKASTFVVILVPRNGSAVITSDDPTKLRGWRVYPSVFAYAFVYFTCKMSHVVLRIYAGNGYTV